MSESMPLSPPLVLVTVTLPPLITSQPLESIASPPVELTVKLPELIAKTET